MDLKRKCLVICMFMVVLSCLSVGCRATPTPQPVIAPTSVVRMPEKLLPMEELTDKWGPYLSEREWGNPREAVRGNGWGLTYHKAIDTAYRYGEDGIAGLSDRDLTVCFSFAFWDERQTTVRERFYGYTNPAGEWGEDIQEERFFWENTLTHSYMRLEYIYPYEQPVYDIQIEYAKADAETLVARVSVKRIDPGTQTPDPLHVLPIVWFHKGGDVTRWDEKTLDAAHDQGHFVVLAEEVPASWQITSNVSGKKGDLNRSMLRWKRFSNGGRGNKGSFDFLLSLEQGETKEVWLAMANEKDSAMARMKAAWVLEQKEELLQMRREEANHLFADQVAEHAPLYRSALMNLLWNRMYYQYDGCFQANYCDKVDLHDVIMVPDKWEFPWPAMWDQCFQAVEAGLVDPELGKANLRVLLSDRWQTKTGHMPNTEWGLGDETPPLFAWAVWELYERDGDKVFLEEMFPRLEMHFSYLIKALDLDRDHLYTAGFMGMDNARRPQGNGVEQADTSGWMAFFARHMVQIAHELGQEETAREYEARYEEIAAAINAQLWNSEDRFYYDRDWDGHLREGSYVGLIPFIAGVADEAQATSIIGHLRDTNELWSTHGIRSLSAASAYYEPGYSTSGWKNSNWRGPVWMPINYLLVQALREHDPVVAEELRENLVTTVEESWQRTNPAIPNMTTCQGRGSQNGPFIVLGSHMRPGNGII